ncbi:MAG: SMP-30/gluconolactonase/LRE family protein [Planctomycetota bacterium]
MTATSPEPRVVAQARCKLGEGPTWHPDEGVLYWHDIDRGRLLRYDPVTGEHDVVYELDGGRTLGALTVQADGSLLLLGGPGAWAAVLRDGELTPVLDGIPGETRFNDALADAAGRVYSGTIPQRWGTTDPDELGSLFRLDPDGSVTKVDTGFGCANGMAWRDDRTLLFTDTPTQCVFAYDYDPADGALRHRRIHLDTRAAIPPDAAPGLAPGSAPDGMTLDADGRLWSARWGGGCVTAFDPDGSLAHFIEFPATNTTSAAFGGPDLATLYVTSAGGDDSARHGPGAGGLFALEIPGVRGRAQPRSRIGL